MFISLRKGKHRARESIRACPQQSNLLALNISRESLAAPRGRAELRVGCTDDLHLARSHVRAHPRSQLDTMRVTARGSAGCDCRSALLRFTFSVLPCAYYVVKV
ncbi:unnamed protein product [Colias eurytheme]|nr:unnamed protein product [Colias eurytheme]